MSFHSDDGFKEDHILYFMDILNLKKIARETVQGISGESLLLQ